MKQLPFVGLIITDKEVVLPRERREGYPVSSRIGVRAESSVGFKGRSL